MSQIVIVKIIISKGAILDKRKLKGDMTVYEGLNYCNSMGEISWGQGIWGGDKGNPRAYGSVS